MPKAMRGHRTMKPIWTPAAERIESAALTRFRQLIERKYQVALPDYQALHRWSIERKEAFWAEVWSFTGVVAQQGFDAVLVDGERFPGCHWFSGARLNFAENLLRYRDDGVALVALLENGRRRQISYRELHEEVRAVAAWLRSRGVVPGDRVVGYLPNVIETVVAMLASVSLGAIWSSCSPDFGVSGVMDRFGQIRPKVLFACDGYVYNGKSHDVLGRVAQVCDDLDCLEGLVVVPVLDPELSHRAVRSLGRDVCLWRELLENAPDDELTFEQLPSEHPLYILYSSGTTGVPKCIVHSAGGTLLQHSKEYALHFDVARGDVFFYFTTCGWTMWNILVSSLLTGCTAILYDGSPFHPGPERLIDLIDQERITVFGVSAKYLTGIDKAGVRPAHSHDLTSLKSILSTGSPLSHESFRYVYRDFKADVCLSSISGGTDIVSCFVAGTPTLPVYEGELQCAGLGMAVEVWNDRGRPVVQEKGELVCVQPFPSCPIGFWNDPGDGKFRSAYFERFEGGWAQGDLAEWTSNDGMIIYGRSDAVLNPGGVRIGTAEIYRQVEKFDDILDAICIGQEWDDDVRVILFVVMREAVELTEDRRETIRREIRANTTPRHVPARILQVADIPRTISGKIAELAVRNVVHGRPVSNTDALANPEALALFRDLPGLQR
jgi:acetoacetyl-CoA synthetase